MATIREKAYAIREKIAVMQAFERGEEIEYRLRSGHNDKTEVWRSAVSPSWAFDRLDYRVKPVPLELYTCLYANGKLAFSSFPTYDLAVKEYGTESFIIKFVPAPNQGSKT